VVSCQRRPPGRDLRGDLLNPQPLHDVVTANAQVSDPPSLERHFGGADGLLPLWIAEPYVNVAPEITAAIEARAGLGWYGYETRPEALADSFWAWMAKRHRWSGADLRTLVSPSIGTSIGVLIEQCTRPGDGVILQPPVFTDFKPLVTSAHRSVVRNSLELTDNGYRLDLTDLENKAAEPTTTALILCNPHNPVGRVWSAAELSEVATICGRHGVFVIADEIHADLTLHHHRWPLGSTPRTHQDIRAGRSLRHPCHHRQRGGFRLIRRHELATSPHPQQCVRPCRVRSRLHKQWRLGRPPPRPR
jgi:aspartate/methionine/tyrosine aminotransferase